MNQNRGLPYARKEENASGERPLKQCGGFNYETGYDFPPPFPQERWGCGSGAAGVLAGCDGNSSSKVPGTEVPDVPGTTSKSVKIIFADVDNGGAGVGNGGDDYEHPVLKDATVIDPKSIPADKIPQGYELADTTPVEIIDNGNTLLAIVKVKKTVDTSINVRVTLQLINGTAADNQRVLVVKMPGDAAYISTDDITLPEDLIWAPGMEGEKRPIGRAIFLVQKV